METTNKIRKGVSFRGFEWVKAAIDNEKMKKLERDLFQAVRYK